MVKRTFFIALTAFFICLTTSFLLFAGEFTASVSSTQVNLSESFTLNLTLKDVTPKESPAISVLKKDFFIHSQQQSRNTVIINGKASSTITWKLSLIPKAEGVAQLPKISIETAEGILSTEPITLNVSKGSSSQSDAGLNVITKVSNAAPYKNEPFTYTALLTSKGPLYNVQTEKMQLEDAIVEIIGEPKLEEKVIEGVLLNVIELTYLITPLKSGSLTIPPVAIQGAIPQKRRGQSGFDDDFDPFGLMQGFERFRPFNLMTEEIQLNILPPVAGISPWIPAKSLTLEEQWPSDQQLRVGEPFNRGFEIKAEGIKASQLPHLDELQNQQLPFKIYADKPEEQENKIQGHIHSMRKEQYTLIPQQAGTVELPEISVNWWDSAKKEKRLSTIPARTVHILPALEAPLPSSHEISAVRTDSPTTPISPEPPFLLYGIIGLLTCLLAGALFWVVILQKKIAGLTHVSQQPKKPAVANKKPVQKEKKEKLPDLNPT